MWPFRRRDVPKVGTITLADVTTSEADYTVFSVGQSRLGASFTALGFANDDPPRFELASLVPVIDPAMKSIADIEIRIDGYVVGYLRPPALNSAIDLLETHRAESLRVPVVLLSTPAGAEVRVHSALS